MSSVGERIKALRIARGLSLQQLGDVCGVSKNAVAQWESGVTKNLKNASLLLLCEEFRTDPSYIVWGADRKPNGRASC